MLHQFVLKHQALKAMRRQHYFKKEQNRKNSKVKA